MQASILSQFYLDPDIIFLNHGSFGATPRPVFMDYQKWQYRLEQQPVKFLGREYSGFLLEARQKLGKYLHISSDDLVLIPNTTYGVNIVARSIHLQPGDEILSTDHEYGACDRIWQFICDQNQAIYRQQPVHIPFISAEEFVEALWQGVTERTRLIFLSHITSPTSTIFPVAAICRRARQQGITTLVDGAHAPGQIPLNLLETGADFYTGNCHKWMMAPKGSAFLYSHPSVQGLVEPLVISWGWQAEAAFSTGSQFIDYLQWYGTRDPAAHLAIPAAIDFMELQHWDQVRSDCHNLAKEAVQRISTLFEKPSYYGKNDTLYAQMASLPLPGEWELTDLKNTLYDEFKIEIPCISWKGRKFLRISVQSYNSLDDVLALESALQSIYVRGTYAT